MSRSFHFAAFVSLAVALLFAPAGRAQDDPPGSITASDCAGGFNDPPASYNPGDEVCGTGFVHEVEPGHILPTGYIEVIPKDFDDPLASVVTPKLELGYTLGGGFIDEPIWLPPLNSGQWEFTVNQAPYESWGPEDARGFYFNVNNNPLVFSVDVAQIKADALAQATGYSYLKFGTKLWKIFRDFKDCLGKGTVEACKKDLKKLLDKQAEEYTCEAAKDLQIDAIVALCELHKEWKDLTKFFKNPLWFSIDKAVELLGTLSGDLATHYLGIAADPPGPDYLSLVPPGATADGGAGIPPPIYPYDDPTPIAYVGIANSIALQSAATAALLPTLERLQGAKGANSASGVVLQAAHANALVNLTIAAGDQMVTQIDAFSAKLADEGMDPISGGGMDTDWIVAAYQQIQQQGYDAETTAFFESFGASASDVQALQNAMAQTDLSKLPAQIDPQAELQALKDQWAQSRVHLSDVAAKLDATVAGNAPTTFQNRPELAVTVPASAVVGQAVSLQAQVTHWNAREQIAVAWDTNLDGRFDDATGTANGSCVGDQNLCVATTASFTPAEPGIHVVSAQATDGHGATAVAFGTIAITAANYPPRISNLVPEDSSPYAAVGDALQFHADAVTTNASDSLTYAWTVDDAPAGTGQDLSFTMPDELPHRIRVTVADSKPETPDATALFVVRAAKWEAQVGDGPDAGGEMPDGGTGDGGISGDGDGGATGGTTGGGGTSGGSGGTTGATSSGGTTTSGGSGTSGATSGCSCTQGAPGLELIAFLPIAAWTFRRARRLRRRPH